MQTTDLEHLGENVCRTVYFGDERVNVIEDTSNPGFNVKVHVFGAHAEVLLLGNDIVKLACCSTVDDSVFNDVLCHFGHVKNRTGHDEPINGRGVGTHDLCKSDE